MRIPIRIVSLERLGSLMERHGSRPSLHAVAAFPEFRGPPQFWPSTLPLGYQYRWDEDRREAWIESALTEVITLTPKAPYEASAQDFENRENFVDVPLSERGFGV